MKLYQVHNRAKVPDIPRMLGKYSGREYTLYRAACFKYGLEPESVTDLVELYDRYTVDDLRRPASQRDQGLSQARTDPGLKYGLSSRQVGLMVHRPWEYPSHPAMPELLQWKAQKRLKKE
jgi:hypothetical protein